MSIIINDINNHKQPLHSLVQFSRENGMSIQVKAGTNHEYKRKALGSTNQLQPLRELSDENQLAEP